MLSRDSKRSKQRRKFLVLKNFHTMDEEEYLLEVQRFNNSSPVKLHKSTNFWRKNFIKSARNRWNFSTCFHTISWKNFHIKIPQLSLAGKFLHPSYEKFLFIWAAATRDFRTSQANSLCAQEAILPLQFQRQKLILIAS